MRRLGVWGRGIRGSLPETALFAGASAKLRDRIGRIWMPLRNMGVFKMGKAVDAPGEGWRERWKGLKLGAEKIRWWPLVNVNKKGTIAPWESVRLVRISAPPAV